MFISKIDKILDRPTLEKVSELLRNAQFIDGKISGGTVENKNNLELNPTTRHYVEVINVIERAIRENPQFNYTAFPRFMTRPIISRYEAGMCYKDHVDGAVMNFPAPADLRPLGLNFVRADLSMTLFLSAPESYDGGELTFEGPFERLALKREAGSAILYPTGTVHSVAPVRKGARVAAVLWIQTMFPVEAHRKAVYGAQKLLKMLEGNKRAEEFALAEENYLNLWRLLASV